MQLARQRFYCDFEERIKNGESLALYAPEFSGKTYFAKTIYDELKTKRKVFLDMNNIYNIDDLYLFFKQTSQDFFKISFDNLFEVDIARIKHVFEIFCNNVSKDNTSFYLFIDNFEKINTIQAFKNKDFIKVFNDCFIQCQNLIFCFTLNNSDGVDLFKNVNSELYGFCSVEELPQQSKEELTHFVVNFFNDNKLKIDMKIVYAIIDKTNGLIFYIKRICDELALIRKDNLTIYDLDCVIDKIYKNYQNYFLLKLNPLRGKKYITSVLYAIANDISPYEALFFKIGDKSHISKMISRLESDDIIIKVKENKNKHIVFDPFLRRYILETFVKNLDN
ncbi:hypothetical protein KDE13_09080 [Campylobacter sp. faydin G-140]|uniref:hypothetical protein n=1 Tax=Campylobacter anatolicus TaxID=2829105 RepID=UPI001B9D59A7|nr:hypothetical protein [Campylobacter anatolicus]MBR8466486.1 hypothetical protein [Campylobacter anatolicus]